MGSISPGRVVLGCVSKQAEQARESKAVRRVPSVPALASLHNGLQLYTEVNPSLLRVALDCVLSPGNSKVTKILPKPCRLAPAHPPRAEWP